MDGLKAYDIGRYRHRIVFQQRSGTLNEFGEPLNEWTDIQLSSASDNGVWGAIREKKGDERELAGSETAYADTEIEVIYRQQIDHDEAIRILDYDRGILYDIVRIENPMFANRVLIFHCRRHNLQDVLALSAIDGEGLGSIDGDSIGGV